MLGGILADDSAFYTWSGLAVYAFGMGSAWFLMQEFKRTKVRGAAYQLRRKLHREAYEHLQVRRREAYQNRPDRLRASRPPRITRRQRASRTACVRKLNDLQANLPDPASHRRALKNALIELYRLYEHRKGTAKNFGGFAGRVQRGPADARDDLQVPYC